MNSLIARLTLGVAGLCCLGSAACSNLVYMSHLAATGTSVEVADAQTTIERRREIAQGLDNVAALQIGLSTAAWWLSLLALLLIVVVTLWGFSRNRRAPVTQELRHA
ncbi:MAG: hypothetical protein KDA92_15335 [Planctomycetales bacterium]|nr:hypothetical protein [Planctomycetales bacterium]